MAVAERHDPSELLRERVAFVMRTMQRATMSQTIERDVVQRWTELLQRALDGDEDWLKLR